MATHPGRLARDLCLNRIRKGYEILRHFGPRFVTQRLGIAVRKRLGITRRVYRSRPWDSIALADICRAGTPIDAAAYAAFREQSPPSFLFPLGRPPQLPAALRNPRTGRQPDFETRLAALREMRCTYFFRELSPTPIDWHANPIDGMRSRAGVPWYEIPDYLPTQGDPRMMWEPARAAWAIDLARAPAHGLNGAPVSCDLNPADDGRGDTGRHPTGELLWRWIDDWMAHCPPYEGFQWKCGQESSVRLIALALGIWSHGNPATLTPDRWLKFARIAWATAYRVDHHIDYAISQKNNHAISEAVGLMLVAHLFPEFRESPRWWRKGRTVLATELRRQVYADGSYVQSSLNYERVMLHGALLGFRLGERAGQPFERELYELVGRCGEFLFQLTDPQTGAGPNTGNNDGAWILPLSECDFADYRPVIQAVHYLVHRRALLPAGPWDEDLCWLFGAEYTRPAHDRGVERPTTDVAGSASPRRSTAFRVGGYYTLRTPESWAMVRCHTFRDRPAHCDQLHLDLWWKGRNVLTDAGTYHYYVPGRPDVEHYFKGIRSHNTIEIDGRDPIELVSRFVWLPWPQARLMRFDAPTGRSHWGLIEAETLDYDRKPWRVRHRRAVLPLSPGAWLVVDDLLGAGEHEAVVRWHLQDDPARLNGMQLTQDTPGGPMSIILAASHGAWRCSLPRACDDRDRVQGWIAPYYGQRLPAVTFEAACRADLPLRVCSLIALGAAAELGLADGARTCAARAGEETWTVRLAPLAREAAPIVEAHERCAGSAAPHAGSLPVESCA